MERTFYISLNLGGLVVEVEGNYTPARAANKSGHPDTWEPPEDGEMEVTAVYNDGVELDCDCSEFAAAWADQIWDKLEEGYE